MAHNGTDPRDQPQPQVRLSLTVQIAHPINFQSLARLPSQSTFGILMIASYSNLPSRLLVRTKTAISRYPRIAKILRKDNHTGPELPAAASAESSSPESGLEAETIVAIDFEREALKHGLFDPRFYAIANPVVVASDAGISRSELDLWTHYWTIGRHEGFRPSACFDPAGYLQDHPDVANSGDEPMEHYLKFGLAEARRIRTNIAHKGDFEVEAQRIRDSDLFDEAFYISQHPPIDTEGFDAATHYLINGANFSFEVSPLVSMQAYLAENPDIRRAGANPLLHYLDWGRYENRELLAKADNATWKNDRHALPDDVVELERMAGIAFFARFGFSLKPDGPTRWVAEATNALAAIEPRLTIERLSPKVTIVIPVYGQLPFALGCLDSLSRHVSRFNVEILVCDDASPEHHQTELLRAIPWIRYLRRDVNGGFIDACNWAVEQARGEYVILLNSDTRVARGWLDEMIGTFAVFPKAGLVGSKFFNDDLSLQEAGGIFWRDGSAWNYGRNDNPNHPRYCFARQVDYCSGAAIAVPTAVWKAAGGFDTLYRPAYCEDADLAFRIREMGFETWYQPLARVIHYEGKTHGRDESSGIKAYQVINLKVLAQRWENRLAEFADNAVDPHNQANRSATKRMLIVDSLNPTPDKDSGSVVTMQMIRSYQKLGYQVSLLAQSNYLFEPRFGPSLQRTGVECLYAPFLTNIDEVLGERSNHNFALIYRVDIATAVFDTIRRRMPLAPIMFHNIDLHYLREMRAAQLEKSEIKLLRAADTRRRELGIIARSDCAIVTSPAETVEIQSQMPQPMQSIVEMPICVDVDRSDVPFSDRNDIIFLAGFAHPPNIDAAEYLVRRVWPLMVSRLPKHARLLIAGSSPSDAVKALASDRVIVTGFVPELKPWFDKSRVFTAPLRYGAGIKGKVIQSLALGTPTVVTGIAAEGIGLTDGVHALIADEPDKLAEAILSLYFNEEKWTQMQQAAYQFVAENLSSDIGTRCCQQAIDVGKRTWLQRSERRLQRELLQYLSDDTSNPVQPQASL